MSGRRRTGAAEVAKLSWGGGQPERLGRKRKKDDSDEESDEKDRGYYTSSSRTSRSPGRTPMTMSRSAICYSPTLL